MRIDKYAGDWRLENVEKKGKIKTVPVYRGDRYGFTYPEKAAAYRKKVPVPMAVLILSALASTMFRVVTMRKWYTGMPLCISMFFLLFLSDSVIRFEKGKDGKLTREDGDKIYSRYMICTFFGLLFVCAAFVGGIAAVVTDRTMAPGDWGYAACVTLSLISYVYLIVNKDAVKTEKVSSKGTKKKQ